LKQKDPIRFGGGDENLYRYVGNDSISYRDLSGKIIVPVVLGVYVAYEFGYFIGALINTATSGTSISGSYSGGYSTFSNFNEQILPGSNLFSQPDTYKVIDDAISNKREKYLEDQIQRQCQ
jgi:hypothetical protein